MEAFESTKCPQGHIAGNISDYDHPRNILKYRLKNPPVILGVIKDQITRAVDVYPEGITQDFMHSVYFCPKERIHISTPARYSPKYVKKPEKMEWFSFSVKARSEVHIILTKDYNTKQQYEIVLQKGQGQSFISKNKEPINLVTTTTTGILSATEFKHFWISWKGQSNRYSTQNRNRHLVKMEISKLDMAKLERHHLDLCNGSTRNR